MIFPRLDYEYTNIATDVFWQENDIIFCFQIVYNEECREDADPHRGRRYTL